MLALLLVAASVGLSNFAAAIAIGVSGVDAATRIRVGLVFGAFESGMPVVGLLVGEQVAGDLGRTARWVGAGLLIGVGLYTLVNAARAGMRGRRSLRSEPGQAATAAATATETAANASAAEPRPPQADDGVAATASSAVAAHPQADDGVAATASSAVAAHPQADDGVAATASSAVAAHPQADDGVAATASSAVAAHPAASHGLWRLLLSGFALSLDNLVVGFALGTYHTSILTGALVIGAVSVGLALLGLELGARIGKWAGDKGEQLAGLVLISVGIAIASGALS